MPSNESDWEMQRLYARMMVGCLHGMSSPRLPCRVKFFRDVGGEISLLCVAVGPEREDGDREIVGLLHRQGAYYGPEPVVDAARADLLAGFD